HLRSNLLSPAFKRQLLSNSRIVFDWGDSMVALGNQKSRVLMALSAGSMNKFIEALNKLYETQHKTVQDLINSFDFGEAAFKRLQQEEDDYATLVGQLWKFARTAVISFEPINDAGFQISDKGIGKSLLHAPIRLRFQYIESACSWSASWSLR